MGLLDIARGRATSLVRGALGNAAGRALSVFSDVHTSADSQATGKKGKVDPLAAARARPDPLMTYDWFCMMPVLSGLTEAPTNLEWSSVEEATLPQVEFEPISNYRAGKTYHYPSHHNLGTLNCKFYEDADATVTAYIRNWQSLIMDRETGLYNPPSTFKFPITFTLFDAAKEDALILTYIGCWPQSPDAYTVDSGQSNRINPGVTFSVDDVTMAFSKFSAKDLSSAGYSGQNFPPQAPQSRSVWPLPQVGIFDR